MVKNGVLYVLVLLIFGIGTFLVLHEGQNAAAGTAVDVAANLETAASSPADQTTPVDVGSDGSGSDLARLLLQVIVILLAVLMITPLFARLGQPAVIAEMFAGLVLGPSVLGMLFPRLFESLFPPSSIDALSLLSQIGVCLFLFLVGMELDLRHVREQAHTAILVCHASMAIPFFLGVVIAIPLHATLAGSHISFVSFALFLGISMSITAFPVLARILQERGLDKTSLGTTALTCAAIGDATAWVLLAFVIAIVRSTGLLSASLSLVFTVAYAAGVLLWLRPSLSRWFAPGDESQSRDLLVLALIMTFGSAVLTELIGIHALFGAFLAGVAMPRRPDLQTHLQLRLEAVSSKLLLPLFFAVTGLRTQVGLLQEPASWMICALVLLVACAGKIGGTMFPARLTGHGWIDSFSLGTLMNTRGLMELVALNIGYDLGILSPRIFTILVVMALATTFMTSPLLALAQWLKRRSGCPDTSPEPVTASPR